MIHKNDQRKTTNDLIYYFPCRFILVPSNKKKRVSIAPALQNVKNGSELTEEKKYHQRALLSDK
jgi:hypothetical protein